jgi:hypothetical protein
MPQAVLALTLVFAVVELPSRPVSIAAPVRVHAVDELAGKRLAYLAARSATMKQVLDVLENSPAISVRLRSNATLVSESNRKAGGQFWLGGGHVIMLLEFDRAVARPVDQIEAVAHEMAHAVEVACLPRALEIDGLVGQMLRRGRQVPAKRGLVAVETPFAQHAGRQIFMEALRGRPGIGRLPELAEKYSLGPPCANTTRLAPGATTSLKAGSKN